MPPATPEPERRGLADLRPVAARRPPGAWSTMSRVTCEPPARPSSDSSPLSDTSTLCKYSPRVIGLDKGPRLASRRPARWRSRRSPAKRPSGRVIDAASPCARLARERRSGRGRGQVLHQSAGPTAGPAGLRFHLGWDQRGSRVRKRLGQLDAGSRRPALPEGDVFRFVSGSFSTNGWFFPPATATA